MSKSPDAFRTISEVAEWLGIQTHVLRFWESKFTQVKPVKRAGGRRYYRPADMLLLGGIKKLLHDDGITIKGVQKVLREKGVGHVSELSQSIDDPSPEPVFDVDPVPIEDDSATIAPFSPTRSTTPSETEEVDDDVQISMDLGQAAEPVDDTVVETVAAEPTGDPVAEPLPDAVADATSAPQPIIVDIADPPAADTLAATPGILSVLPNLRDLTGAEHAKIATLAQALRDWRDRATNLRNG
ncbi:MerR family transcriptional regulator [Phaeobacter marinintestinus]|uniref:MerR family transcriptional regulator n=1 Tax=Falsiphaeobacter marinintestinus TaxID=1492905 RepID=UPI0011B36D11|nr:MerR family transcriptional regulator [Phaeobacter marinintestinus]